MAERYIAQEAINDFNQQQISRGEAVYSEDYSEVIHQEPRTFTSRASRGLHDERARNDVIESELGEQYRADARALAAYERMQAEAREIDQRDDAFDPDYETYIDGQRVDDGSFAPESDDDDEDGDQYYEEEQEDEEYEEEEFSNFNWDEFDPSDESTYPTPQDALEEMEIIEANVERNPQDATMFYQVAQQAESEGHPEYAFVATQARLYHLGRLSAEQALRNVVSELGHHEAIRIFSEFRANDLFYY